MIDTIKFRRTFYFFHRTKKYRNVYCHVTTRRKRLQLVSVWERIWMDFFPKKIELFLKSEVLNEIETVSGYWFIPKYVRLFTDRLGPIGLTRSITKFFPVRDGTVDCASSWDPSKFCVQVESSAKLVSELMPLSAFICCQDFYDLGY